MAERIKANTYRFSDALTIEKNNYLSGGSNQMILYCDILACHCHGTCNECVMHGCVR